MRLRFIVILLLGQSCALIKQCPTSNNLNSSLDYVDESKFQTSCRNSSEFMNYIHTGYKVEPGGFSCWCHCRIEDQFVCPCNK
jgi:hypothetical protein